MEIFTNLKKMKLKKRKKKKKKKKQVFSNLLKLEYVEGDFDSDIEDLWEDELEMEYEMEDDAKPVEPAN